MAQAESAILVKVGDQTDAELVALGEALPDRPSQPTVHDAFTCIRLPFVRATGPERCHDPATALRLLCLPGLIDREAADGRRLPRGFPDRGGEQAPYWRCRGR